MNAPVTFTVDQVVRLLATTTLALRECAIVRQSIRFSGIISTADTRVTADGIMYKVEVADSRDASQILRLRLPLRHWRTLGLHIGAAVTVTGFLNITWASRWSAMLCLVDVTEILSATPPPGEAATFDLQAFLRRHPCHRHRFPRSTHSISVIYPKNSADRCLQDFRKKLPSASPTLETLPVNILDGMDIARAILDATGDILVILRGGGNREGFQCFDEPDVLIAIIEKDIYTVTGLGHADNTTYADIIADFAGLTPTDAGIHLHECLEEQRLLRQARQQRALAPTQPRRHWRLWLMAAFCVIAGAVWLFMHWWQ